MSLLSAKPSELLSPYIIQYWMIENVVPGGESHIQRIVPSGLMELTFYLGDRPRVIEPNKDLCGNALLSGQLSKYYDLEVTGNLSIFSVTFKPQGVRSFFNLPLIEFFDRNIPLDFIEKEAARRIENELRESKGFKAKVSAIEKFLLKQIRKNCDEYNQARIHNSISAINRSKGIISVDALASHACLSKKQYTRIIRDFVGISPKQFLRIVRFQHTIYQRQINPKVSLTDLSYNCGYFDQSHMIADFKDFSGQTPKQFFAECEQPYSDYFSV